MVHATTITTSAPMTLNQTEAIGVERGTAQGSLNAVLNSSSRN
jgi:hypothetical protein